jgi:hypothetical protein
MAESNESRWRAMARRAQRDGLAHILWSGLKRVGNDCAPSWLFRASDTLLVAMPQLRYAHIPTLRGLRSQIMNAGQISQLLPITGTPAALPRLFDHGSICVMTEAPDGQSGAMAWAWLGPGDCPVEAWYRHGFRWRLRSDEAWLHNGEASSAQRRTGVYLSAYRALLEELARRGIRRCYGRISVRNPESLQVHRRLGLSPFAHISYRRIALVGIYRLHTDKTSRRIWTLRPAVTISLADWLESFLIQAARVATGQQVRSTEDRTQGTPSS